MKSFMTKHASNIKGVLHCLDRLILRGYLPIASCDYFLGWLTYKKIALNLKELPAGWRSLKDVAPWLAEKVKAFAQATAAKAGRPYQHLPSHQRM